MRAGHAIRREVPGKKHPTERGSLPLTYRHTESFRATAAQDLQGDGFANSICIERREKIIRIADSLATDCYQSIANQQAALFGRPTFLKPQNQQAMFLFALEGLAPSLRDLNRLRTDAEISSLDRAMGCQSLCNLPRNLDRDR